MNLQEYGSRLLYSFMIAVHCNDTGSEHYQKPYEPLLVAFYTFLVTASKLNQQVCLVCKV